MNSDSTKGTFFCVCKRYTGCTSDYLQHGFDTEERYRQALQRLCHRFGGRVGEQTDERNGFIRLRFRDTPDGCPDEVWIPRIILRLTAPPDYLLDTCFNAPQETMLDEIFGFD